MDGIESIRKQYQSASARIDALRENIAKLPPGPGKADLDGQLTIALMERREIVERAAQLLR